MDDIFYTDEEPIDADQFIDLLERSGLGERRPVDDRQRIASMVLNADILMTAWRGDLLVGIARSVTDFSYCCYLSDLAVDRTLYRQGIGRTLMQKTAALVAPACKLILLSAPDATEYYPAQGFSPHDSAWVRNAGDF
ncbi:MAG: GNAT family N-acetyltransferase [Woeseiaceae bacterium]